MRYYFHINDGAPLFDDEGLELPNMTAVQQEAVLSSADLIKINVGPNFWAGQAWRLWVTDLPNGCGNTILSLEFTAHDVSKSVV